MVANARETRAHSTATASLPVGFRGNRMIRSLEVPRAPNSRLVPVSSVSVPGSTQGRDLLGAPLGRLAIGHLPSLCVARFLRASIRHFWRTRRDIFFDDVIRLAAGGLFPRAELPAKAIHLQRPRGFTSLMKHA